MHFTNFMQHNIVGIKILLSIWVILKIKTPKSKIRKLTISN